MSTLGRVSAPTYGLKCRLYATAEGLDGMPPDEWVLATLAHAAEGGRMQSIDLAELKRLVQSGAQPVEVLPEEEYAEEHLPGAISIPLKVLDAQTSQQLDRSKPVVVYCYDGL
jgi:3-mercaptopyruvate sulfurtransferase SseA